MAATQAQARKTITMPANARNTRAAAQAAPETTARKPRVARTPKAPTAESVWVETLVGASGFHRDAFNIEVAVGLAVYLQKADAEKVTLDAKRELMAVYASAGYACESPVGEDYKTVNRRVNVTADLFVKLGGRATLLDHLTEGMAPAEQVSKLLELVKSLGFNGPNDVLAYCGRPVATKRPRHQNLGAGEGVGQMTPTDAVLNESLTQAMERQKMLAELPPGRILRAGPLEVAIPFETTYSDVMQMASALAEFAAKQMPKPAVATAVHQEPVAA